MRNEKLALCNTQICSRQAQQLQLLMPMRSHATATNYLAIY